MEMTREKLLRAYPEMPKSTALRLEHTLEKLQSGAYEKSAQGAPKRIGFVMALAIVLLAAAIGTAACARLGVFDFMSRSGGRTGVLPGAQELVQTDLAALETEHARLAVTEAVYDGATLRLVYSITAKGIDAPLTEENLPQCDVILVAIRPGAAIDWVEKNAPHIGKNAILVDLCGVKRTVVAAIAPIAAFGQGGEWLEELRAYLWENRKTAEDFIRTELPGLITVSADATYLLWIDCNALPGDLSDLSEFIRRESGLFVCDGREYGSGYGFLRMNLACRRELVGEGLERLKRSITAWRKENAEKQDFDSIK